MNVPAILSTPCPARKSSSTRRAFLGTLATAAAVALAPAALPVAAAPESSPDLCVLRSLARPARPIPPEHARLLLDVALGALGAVERERGGYDREAGLLFQRIVARCEAGVGRGLTLADLPAFATGAA